MNTTFDAVRDEKLIVPDDDIPESPENTPAEDTSHDVVSIARVFAPPPIVTAPVVVPVPIAVVEVDELLLIEVPPDTVSPVSVPRDVIAVCAAPVTVAAEPETFPEAFPISGVVKTGEFANTSAPLPVSSDTAFLRLADVMVPVAEEYIVPAVGRVTDVAPVVRRESELVGENVTTSPPASVIEFVPIVAESDTVNVFPLAMFNVFEALFVIVNPFIVLFVRA